jgi:tRNA nucleotidyltransferase (CCA-adding enzyme)
VEVPAASELMEMVRALPAAAPLLQRNPNLDRVYLVGGAVRDLLLGSQPVDLDFVVEGDAEAFARALGKPRFHDRFGTSTVALGGFVYDIAQARTESYARPGALPDVAPAPLEQDLHRRDFTVNALAIGLGGGDPGELKAVPMALADLEARMLRVLHPRSFVDDPTRLLRLGRYASRLGFEVEPHTRGLAAAALDAVALSTVSGPRIGTELRLAAHEPDPVTALNECSTLGLDRAIHPRFGITDPDLVRRALELLPPDGRSDALVLASANLRIGNELPALLDALGFTAEDRDLIASVALEAAVVTERLAKAGRPSEIAAAVGSGSPELVALAGAMGPANPANRWLSRLRHIGLEIDGRDLMAAGVPEGPAVGRGLRAALAAKLDGDAVSWDAELARALEAATGTG